MFADVLLVTTAMRNAFMDDGFCFHELGNEEMTTTHSANERAQSRPGLVTTASLRIRRMPEDIPETHSPGTSKKESAISEGVEAVKRKVAALKAEFTEATEHNQRRNSHSERKKHKNRRPSQTAVAAEDIELEPINEEAQVTNDFVEHLAEESATPIVIIGPVASATELRHMDSSGDNVDSA